MAVSATQAKIRRCVKAVRESGLDVGRIEIDPDGTVRVIVGKASEAADTDDWDAIVEGTK